MLWTKYQEDPYNNCRQYFDIFYDYPVDTSNSGTVVDMGTQWTQGTLTGHGGTACLTGLSPRSICSDSMLQFHESSSQLNINTWRANNYKLWLSSLYLVLHC